MKDKVKRLRGELGGPRAKPIVVSPDTSTIHGRQRLIRKLKRGLVLRWNNTGIAPSAVTK
jgi:hypothetical protein